MSLKIFTASLKGSGLLIPRIKQYLIKEDDLLRGGKIRGKDIVMRDADMTIACFKERKIEYNHRQQLNGDYFHPSQLGGCLRAYFYGEFKAPVDGLATADEMLRTSLIFEMGTYVHVMIQNLCERAGLLISRETAIQDKLLGILGHADGQLLIDGEKYLLEIKTINSRGFGGLREVKDAHKKQIHAYMKALRLKAAVVIYINKDTCELREFVIRFDQLFYEQEVAARIQFYFACKKSMTLPPKEGESLYRMPCSYCSFRKICSSKANSAAWLAKIKLAKLSAAVKPSKRVKLLFK